MVRLKAVEVCGFRAFGKTKQRLEFSSGLAVVWGANSQGKTSLAEALEFLLTGKIGRRDFMASALDEFADSLRNAHIANSTDVYVACEFADASGKIHTLKRRLIQDYTKKQNCASALEIDGKAASATDIASTGIVLLEPPLAAPILMQHTLAYLFSVGPQERANYFKAILEVTDLDTVRNTISESESTLDEPENPSLAKLNKCAAVPAFQVILARLSDTKKRPISVSQALHDVGVYILKQLCSEEPPSTLTEQVARIKENLAARRSTAFPIAGFDRRPLRTWGQPQDACWNSLSSFVTALAKVDAESQQLAVVFSSVLAIPSVAGATQAVDCPVCQSVGVLTPNRIAGLREYVKEKEDFSATLEKAKAAITQLRTLAKQLQEVVAQGCPSFIVRSMKERRKLGFSVVRVHELAGAEHATEVERWLEQARHLIRKCHAILRGCKRLVATIDSSLLSMAVAPNVDGLKAKFCGLTIQHAELVSLLSIYDAAEKPVKAAVIDAIDKQSKTVGWQEWLDLTEDEAGLTDCLIDVRARNHVRRELQRAIKLIESDKGKVLDEKFQQLSDEVVSWWETLRPDEPTFFSKVAMRPGAKRTIDFKAGLCPESDKSQAVLRDVIAVFSQSQLHCLGLASFIARTVRSKCPFLVLDDPILSSDEDHRVAFNCHTIEKMLEIGVQVVIFTQDEGTKKNLAHRYSHKGVDVFEIVLESAAIGATVKKTSDTLDSLLAEADPFAKSAQPASRTIGSRKIRCAAERFCKEVLVQERRKSGEPSVNLTTYDGVELGQLIINVTVYLTDPSHVGKLNTIRQETNPGNHDHKTPTSTALKCAIGDLRRLKKDYGL